MNWVEMVVDVVGFVGVMGIGVRGFIVVLVCCGWLGLGLGYVCWFGCFCGG